MLNRLSSLERSAPTIPSTTPIITPVMTLVSTLVSILVTTILTSGCAPQSKSAISTHGDQLRAMNVSERMQDYEAMVSGFRDLYGPLELKEKRFHIDFDQMVSEFRQKALAAQTDDEFLAMEQEFITRFQDGHLSIETAVENYQRYTVPLVVMPVENKFVIAKISDPKLVGETGIEVGDELLEVDGKPPESYLPIILKYSSVSNPISDRHMIYQLLKRPSYLLELKPAPQSSVHLKLVKANGTILERDLQWKWEVGPQTIANVIHNTNPPAEPPSTPAQPPALPNPSTKPKALLNSYSRSDEELLTASLGDEGTDKPLFANDKTEAVYNWTQVNPSSPFLKKYGLKDLAKTPKLFAMLYRQDGKNLLLIRQGTYHVTDADARISWYKAVLDEYGRFADALVIDQTHNPGGSISYANQFISIFGKKGQNRVRGAVDFLRADRRWLHDLGVDSANPKTTALDKALDLDAYHLVETAYDKGESLTERPISISGLDYIVPAKDFQFTKPILFLTDELSGSCGDLVPMIFKANQLAVLFGERTMGLGGNVEPAVQLPVSQAQIHITRGLFTLLEPDGNYDHPTFIENDGVTPDIHYQQTLSDFRAGYVSYMAAFSKAAAALVPPAIVVPAPGALANTAANGATQSVQ